MNRKVKATILILIVLVGIWTLYHRHQIHAPKDVFRLASEDISGLRASIFQSSQTIQSQTAAIDRRTPETVRIASFRLNGSTGAALKPDASKLMTEIVRRFDLIALQDVASNNPEWVAQTVANIKAQTGQDYRFVASPFVDDRQFVMLFNANMLEAPLPPYTVNDPDNLFERDPYVCWFRTRVTKDRPAFTFSLVNFLFNESGAEQEIEQLGNLYRAIRDDGRREDDVILVGDFGVEGSRILQNHETGLRPLLGPEMTNNTLRTVQSSNLLFSPVATVELSSNGGTLDFMRHFNLYLDDALRFSDHLPIWADVSIYEGVAIGRWAKQTEVEHHRESR